MRRLLAHRPSPAMVVACIALIVALGGTGYAAITLPRNSVGAAQLRSGAVTSAKIRDRSIRARDIATGAVPRGPRGPAGPAGQSAPGAIPRAGYTSRDPVLAGGAIPVGGAGVDVLDLGTPTGTGGVVASSGALTTTGPSRLVADGQAVILNGGTVADNVSCQIVLIGTDVRAIGNYVNARIEPANGYVPVAVSAGTDVEAGTYTVRVRCSSGGPAMSFHRGNLIVTVAPR